VAVLKQVMMMKPDKLRGECENSQVTEELAVCTVEVELLKEQLKSCDKEWQERLRAETDRWQDSLEEHQQDVETEQAKMAEAMPVPCMGEKYRQSCGGETERRILGRHRSKCGIILSLKK
jgi:hypothetical protein